MHWLGRFALEPQHRAQKGHKGHKVCPESISQSRRPISMIQKRVINNYGYPLGHKGTRTTQSLTLGWFVTSRTYLGLAGRFINFLDNRLVPQSNWKSKCYIS